MNIKEMAKDEVKKKIKRIIFKIIKPFVPFIVVIILIIFSLCTVIDTIFTTEDDMQMIEKIASDDYEEQYTEWIKEKESSPNTIINDSKGLIQTRNV